ncbi:MAG: DUF4430 domain-containing protein [Clostridia bacterium]|nr:DUF4430 domain-containing protein [Clostridia bacterium]
MRDEDRGRLSLFAPLRKGCFFFGLLKKRKKEIEMTTKSKKRSASIRILSLALVILCLFFAVSCVERKGAWENATYTTDQTFGEGSKTVTVTVTAEEQTITFTIRTDAETLEEAMVENELVDGDESTYGLYIKYVNGIRADYNLDGGYYWGLTKDGESTDYGASSATLTDGDVYGFIRTK